MKLPEQYYLIPQRNIPTNDDLIKFLNKIDPSVQREIIQGEWQTTKEIIMNIIDNDNQKKIINKLDILIYAFDPACTNSEAIVKNKALGLNYWLTQLIKTLLDSIKEKSLKVSNNRKWDEISEKSISNEISK